MTREQISRGNMILAKIKEIEKRINQLNDAFKEETIHVTSHNVVMEDFYLDGLDESEFEAIKSILFQNLENRLKSLREELDRL